MAQRYRRSVRITEEAHFSSIFKHRCIVRSAHFSIFAKPNASAFGRLGMTVAKRTAARAVDRNYMKRVIREIFRHHLSHFVGIDAVIQAKQPFSPGRYEAIEGELLDILAKVRRKCLISC